MKDIFDIIENRKDKHIKIKGEISEYSLVYEMNTINDFYLILLDNTDHMDVTTFNINENNAYTDINVYDITISAQRSTYSSIEFDIDIYVDNYLWRKLSDFEDFIYYYTEGAIKYDNKYVSSSMIDRLEEYMSERIIENPSLVSSNIIFDELSLMDRPLIDELSNIPVVDFNGLSREQIFGDDYVPPFLRSTDADGDAVFTAEFRPTDMSNMFRNASIDFSRLD